MELAANQSAQPAPKKREPVPTRLLLAAMAQAEALLEHEGVPFDGQRLGRLLMTPRGTGSNGQSLEGWA